MKDFASADIPHPPVPTSLPTPFITLASSQQIPNLRVLSSIPLPQHPSYSSTNPVALRPGILFRSAGPYQADVKALEELGVRWVWDLRSRVEVEGSVGGLGWAQGQNGLEEESTGERALNGVEESQKVRRIWAPVFKEEDYSPETLAGRFLLYMSPGAEPFAQAYRQVLDSAGPSFRTILVSILAHPQQGHLVHCTAGKDRTGLFIALLLSLLGAKPDTIADEYALTEVGLASLKPYFMNKIWEGVKKYNPGLLEEWGEDGVRQGVERSVGARREVMVRTLELLDESYGGAEGYLEKQCNLSEEQIKKLREVLVLTGEQQAAML